MSTPERHLKGTAPGTLSPPEGATCRCPYCGEPFNWPPPGLRCPVCNRVMRPPPGYAKPGREARRRALTSIERQAEARRRRMGATPVAPGKRQPGFLLLIIAGLAVLGGAVISLSVRQSPATKRAKRDPVALTRSDLSVFATALEHYRADVGHYPDYEDGGLLALISDPGEPDWLGPYINVIQNDGWRRPYAYDRTNGVPVLFSAGPDRRYETGDDLHAAPADFICHPDFIPRDSARRRVRAPAPAALPPRE